LFADSLFLRFFEKQIDCNLNNLLRKQFLRLLVASVNVEKNHEYLCCFATFQVFRSVYFLQQSWTFSLEYV